MLSFVLLQTEKDEWEAFVNPVEDFGALTEKDLNTFLSTVEENTDVKFEDVFSLVQVSY